MDKTTLAQRERNALCDLFLEVDPHLPTLCGGWVAYDLVAHLWVRENDPAAGLGIVLPVALGKIHDARIARARRLHEYADLVEKVRQGPGRLSPMRQFDSVADTLEFLIHHEDLRRGETFDVPEREFSAADEAEIMTRLDSLAKLMLRSRTVRTVLVDAHSGRRVSAGHGPTTVTVTGAPTELALYTYGRARAAHVVVERAGSELPDD